jgi:hypothetical protein
MFGWEEEIFLHVSSTILEAFDGDVNKEMIRRRYHKVVICACVLLKLAVLFFFEYVFSRLSWFSGFAEG